jgi:hypothetical protein
MPFKNKITKQQQDEFETYLTEFVQEDPQLKSFYEPLMKYGIDWNVIMKVFERFTMIKNEQFYAHPEHRIAHSATVLDCTKRFTKINELDDLPDGIEDYICVAGFCAREYLELAKKAQHNRASI